MSEIVCQENILLMKYFMSQPVCPLFVTVKSILRGLAGSFGDKFGKGHQSSSGDYI